MSLWRIYRYRNVITNQSYIGQTIRNVNDRAGKDGSNYNFKFKEAIDKYGWDSFEQSILRLCTTQEEADSYERFFIDKYNTVYPNGYNLESGGKSNKTVNDVTKSKISESLSGENNPFYGQHHTEESRQKNREAHLGRCPTEESRRKHSESISGEKHWNYGNHYTEEHRKKLSEAHIGWKDSEETKRRKSEAQKGKRLGMHYYNNGIVTVMTYECPEGFVPGRVKKTS